jgi:hypothetical protein
MSLSALCKVCLYYNPSAKTCGRSVVAIGNGNVHHDYAKAVRLNKNQCGPQGRWFTEVLGEDGLKKKTPIDELFEDFDM